MLTAKEGKTVQYNRQRFGPGDSIPEDLITGKELDRLLDEGVIEYVDERALEGRRARTTGNLAREIERGKWNVNPATLEGKNLQQLNAMILERDPEVQPFETVQEARAFLSQDFG